MDHLEGFQFCNAYILPGEHILWRGRPEKGKYFSGQDFIMIPFSIFWLGFSLFWEVAAIQSGIPFMMLWGLPFVGIGIYLLFGRYLHAACLRSKTFYVVTNKKLIIKNGNRITTYQTQDLPPMTLRMHNNGNGTISFTEAVRYRGGRSYHNYFALENIPDPVKAQIAINSMDR